MNSRFDPRINRKIDDFLHQYPCFRGVFDRLTWLKSTDPQALSEKDHVPCWVQYGDYKMFVVLNEKVLLQPEYLKFVSFLICHEILHVMKSHPLRCQELPEVIAARKKLESLIDAGGPLPSVLLAKKEYDELCFMWNIAADMVVNSMVRKRDRLPGGVPAPANTGKGVLSAEEYFRQIYDKRQEDKKKKEKEGEKEGEKVGEKEGDEGPSPHDSGESLEEIFHVNIVSGNPKGGGGDDSGDNSDSGDGTSEPPTSEDGDHKCGENSDGGTPPGGTDPQKNKPRDAGNGGGEGLGDPKRSPRCTCVDPPKSGQRATPCVHSFAPGDVEMPTKSPPLPKDESPDQPLEGLRPPPKKEIEIDHGEPLRLALEEGFKSMLRDPDTKLGEAAKNADVGNYRAILGGSSRMDSFQKTMIREFEESAPFRWDRLLSSFLKTGSKVEVKFSRKRRDRRFGTRPGIQIVQKKHIGFVIDTSCSMDTSKIMALKPILDSLSKLMDVTLIHCDDQVRHCEKWRSRDFVELRGGGGTEAEPAIEKCKALKVDGMVYFTDGFFWDSEYLHSTPAPSFETVWLLVGVGRSGYERSVSALAPWGKRTVVD